MAPSFEHEGDTFGYNSRGKQGREKFIHCQGNIGRVSLVANPNPFTGIFQGAKNGFMRLSSAKDPSSNNSDLTPGMGLKFVRSNVDSANLVAMYSVNGNPKGDTNFFSQDFTNHLGPADNAPLKLV